MSSASELWLEARPQTRNEVVGALIRDELNRERVSRIDLTYVGNDVNSWWSSRKRLEVTEGDRSELRLLILERLRPDHRQLIECFGSSQSRTAALFLENTFGIAERRLGVLVHEAIAEIAGIVDVKYPYEDHKELYPTSANPQAADWGRGQGIIRPHSDDLYEDRAVNAMCLTVCRDISSTPTWFWLLKDVVACLSDDELGEFALGEADYYSGTNVEGRTIQVRKPILRRDPDEGIGMRIDFRIDDQVGARMRPVGRRVQQAFDKMRIGLRSLRPVCSNPVTGSVSLLANYKVLHGRSALDPVMLYEGENSRILFRSKGTRLAQVNP